VLSSISEGRKIAVLGDMLELGEIAAKEHYKVGVKAAEESDIIITCGKLSEKISQGAQSLGKQTKNFSEKEEKDLYQFDDMVI
jgi:UDP-N-acetylmuramoyl-tripeptide--D-alanyl-D-alanine ligase